MKPLFQFFFILFLVTTVFPIQGTAAGVEPLREDITTSSPSKKEIKAYQKKQKRMARIRKWVHKHEDKLNRLTKDEALNTDDYLTYTLLFLAAAFGLAILSIFVGFLWYLAGIAALGAAVFFILWLVEYA